MNIIQTFYNGMASRYDSELWYQWTEEGYRLYMDGTDEDSLLFFFPGDQYGDGTCAVPCGLIISAEYGTWGGAIDPEQLPAHFFVDYVKIYQPEKRTDDLYTTEPEVIAKLERDELSAAQWRRFRSMKRMSRSETRPAGETWRQVSAKKRCIDPMVKDQGRVSNLSPAFRDDLNAFLCEGTDLWISGSVS